MPGPQVMSGHQAYRLVPAAPSRVVLGRHRPWQPDPVAPYSSGMSMGAGSDATSDIAVHGFSELADTLGC